MNNSYVPHSNGNKHTNNAQGGGREGVCVVLLNKSGKAFLRVTLERRLADSEGGGRWLRGENIPGARRKSICKGPEAGPCCWDRAANNGEGEGQKSTGVGVVFVRIWLFLH